MFSSFPCWSCFSQVGHSQGGSKFMIPNVHLHLSLTRHPLEVRKKCGLKKKEKKKLKRRVNQRRLATCILANHIPHQLLMSANCCQFHVNRTGTSIFAPANVSHYDKLKCSGILYAHSSCGILHARPFEISAFGGENNMFPLCLLSRFCSSSRCTLLYPFKLWNPDLLRFSQLLSGTRK